MLPGWKHIIEDNSKHGWTEERWTYTDENKTTYNLKYHNSTERDVDQWNFSFDHKGKRHTLFSNDRSDKEHKELVDFFIKVLKIFSGPGTPEEKFGKLEELYKKRGGGTIEMDEIEIPPI